MLFLRNCLCNNTSCKLSSNSLLALVSFFRPSSKRLVAWAPGPAIGVNCAAISFSTGATPRRRPPARAPSVVSIYATSSPHGLYPLLHRFASGPTLCTCVLCLLFLPNGSFHPRYKNSNKTPRQSGVFYSTPLVIIGGSSGSKCEKKQTTVEVTQLSPSITQK